MRRGVFSVIFSIHMKERLLIGFIGQGFIGKNYADDFEHRGYSVVRYALEEPYVQNKEKIKDCEIVFIAVPTPTTPDGFSDEIVLEAVTLAGKGSTVVIKSTMAVGTTESVASQHKDKMIVHSPEFLAESTAAHDAAHPTRNVIGIPEDTPEYREIARKIIAVLPEAPFSLICSAKEAELIKYTSNCFLFTKVLFANLMHDLAEAHGASWDVVREGVASDPRIGGSHLRAVDTSGHPGAKPGRGAGGHCFIKDFAALREMYEKVLPNDSEGLRVLRALECKNVHLLMDSDKDLDLLSEVYGDDPKQACDF